MSSGLAEYPERPGYLLTLTWFPESGVGGVNQAIFNLARVMNEGGQWQPYLLVTSHVAIPAVHPQLPCPADSVFLKAPDLPQDRPVRSLLSFAVSLPGTLGRLNRYLKQRRISAVSCHFPETDSINFALLRRLGIYKGKFILSFHGEDIRVLIRKHSLGKWFARWMMRNADALVACSRGLMEDLVAFEPACARRATVIYNAIDIAAFRSRIDFGFELPAALQGKVFLLNVARYEHKKGHDILIRAFEKLAAEFPQVLLVTIGGSVGGESAGVRAMVEQSTARERILMLENVPHPQVGVFLKAAQLFVLASRREGFPFVLLEAGAMQIPVAAAACLGVPEIIEDGVTGRLAPVEDADALADAIADLLGDGEKRGRMARALHELVARDFSWTAIYRKHADLVNSGGSTD